MSIVDEKNGDSATATVEFEQKEDTLAAQTKDGKLIEDRMVQVQIGTGSTLYVTNFPPIADAQYIRDLFKDCGEIVDIRFPSLKYKQTRRFCYVQFSSSAEAERATQLHGKQLGAKETLVALISAPNQKKERSGAAHEGRELYVRNIPFEVPESEIIALLSPYGEIESTRFPPGPRKGTHKGFGFVTFVTKSAADASLATNGTLLKGRSLLVEIANPNHGKPPKPNPVEALAETNGASSSSTTSPAADPAHPKPTFQQIKTKTLGIMNLPDTLNDLRLTALFAPFGALRKVNLRPDHSGAIVEYENVADAGKAALQMEGKEIEGHKIRIGTLEELMAQKPEKRKMKGFEKGRGGAQSMVPASVRSAAARGGRKRGLGFVGAMSRSNPPTQKKEGGEGEAAEGEKKGGKSNEDFKNMFLKR